MRAVHSCKCWLKVFVQVGKTAHFASLLPLLKGWMDDLRFYVLFNSISVISGRWEVDNERLYVMEPFTVEKNSP